jgi:Cu+-exporting ATPase
MKEVEPDQNSLYTCAMHPQIRQRAPGQCPFCGMALERENYCATDDDNPGLEDMTRRFVIGARGAGLL